MKQKFRLKKVLLVAPIKSILHSNAQDFFACDKIVVFIYHTDLSCHTEHSLCYTDLFFCYTDKFVILSASEVSIQNADNGLLKTKFMDFSLSSESSK